MALQNSQVVALQLEKVRPKLPILYERDDAFFSLIQKREVERVSTRTARIPLQVQPGGAFGYASFDGGDLGRGSGTSYDFAQITPVGIRFAVEITKLVEYATDATDKAVENAAKRNVADAMKQFRRDLDASLQTAGNGVFGTVASVASPVITLANTPFGARLLHENQNVQVYDPTLTTNRGTATISAVSKSLGGPQTITVSSVPAGTAANDVLVVDGVSGASPTFIYGIPYHHSTSTAGTWMGISRANPYAVANGVNANGAALTLPPIRLAFNQIRQAIGVDSLGSLLWHGHPSQVAAYEELGFVISEIEKGGSNQDLDLLFRNKTMGGVKIKENVHADTTRLDLINLETWGRVEWLPIDFYEVGGSTVFPVYGASGGVAASYLFYLVTGVQFFVDNPRAVSSVTGLGLPSGY
ncbi:MAG TPA: hypothetical protein VN709_04035 [Terriglobales bacterium]|nr:hypothetical protein [Terriglobales bacterium]